MDVNDIVLVGPMAAGKSTIARLLARRLDWPVVSMDAARWPNMVSLGYDRARANKIERSEGVHALHAYRQPFEAKALAAILTANDHCIFDFGAGHTEFDSDDDAALLIRNALASCKHVFAILPTEDDDTNVRLLTERIRARGGRGEEFVESFVKSGRSRALAMRVIHTEGKTAEECCAEIMAFIIGAREVAGNDANAANAKGDGTIDRSSVAQHRALVSDRLSWRSDYFSVLERTQRRRSEVLERRMAACMDKSLTEEAYAIATTCLENVDWLVRTTLSRAEMTDEARARSRGIYGVRLSAKTTLRELMAMDPFDGVFPYQDGLVLERLAISEDVKPLSKTMRDLVDETLRHRFLHRPQRTKLLFLHEIIVGHFLNVMKSSGLVPSRADLNPTMDYEPIAAYAAGLIADASNLSLRDTLALHCATNETVETRLPLFVREILLTSAHVYFYMELLMLYMLKGATRRILTDLLLFFTVPLLEKAIDASRQTRTSTQILKDAGLTIDDAFCSFVYGDAKDQATQKRAPSEVDIILVLSRLSKELVARRSDVFLNGT